MNRPVRGSGLAKFWKPDFDSQKLISTIIRGYWNLNKGKIRYYVF